jgi:hypothetical protein
LAAIDPEGALTRLKSCPFLKARTKVIRVSASGMRLAFNDSSQDNPTPELTAGGSSNAAVLRAAGEAINIAMPAAAT